MNERATTSRSEAAIKRRLVEIEFEADDELTEWVFDQVADLVHNTEGVIDPTVSAGTAPDESGSRPMPETAITVSLTTLQFHTGGIFDGRPIEDAIHLVRATERGTPGPTLCGIDRFAKDAPGWSVGGGFSGDYEPCAGCNAARFSEFPDLAVWGMHRPLFENGSEPQP